MSHVPVPSPAHTPSFTSPCTEATGARATAWHRAEVAKPALALSRRTIAFQHTWEPGLEPAQMVQLLEVSNVSALPLEVRLRTSPPFGVSQALLTLEADAGAIVDVTCDAAMRCAPCCQA